MQGHCQVPAIDEDKQAKQLPQVSHPSIPRVLSRFFGCAVSLFTVLFTKLKH